MIEFSVVDTIVIIGQNPEMADMTNPRGNIFAPRWQVVAINSKGYRWSHNFLFSDAERAEKLCHRIAAAFRAGRKLSINHWNPMNPVYGSEAYVNSETEFYLWLSEQEGAAA